MFLKWFQLIWFLVDWWVPGNFGTKNFNNSYSLVDALHHLKHFTGKNFLFEVYTQQLYNGSFALGIKPSNNTIEKYKKYLDLNGKLNATFLDKRQKFLMQMFESIQLEEENNDGNGN